MGLSLIYQTSIAATVENLYNTAWPVENQTQNIRDQAMSEAMSEILIRVSGSQDVLSISSIRDALGRSNRYILSFHYSPNENMLLADPQEFPLLLNVKFDKRQINQLLQNASAKLWSENRPLILGWVMYSDIQNGRQLIDESAASPITELFKAESGRRGLPFLLPRNDLNVTNNYLLSDIWGHFEEPVREISEPYGANSFLMVSLEQRDTIRSRWTIVDDCGKRRWDFSSQNVSDHINAGIDAVADFLGGCYSLALNEVNAETLSLVISPIRNVKDYGLIMNTLENLTAVKHINVSELGNQNLRLSVSVNGSETDLKNAIKLSRRLLLRDELGVAVDGQRQLVYEWVP
ncbi:MAG: DUF2066 domain-containing protein [Pseudomonadota bacterium]